MDTGVIISLAALLISGIGLLLSSRKESRADAAGTARMEAKLDSIGSGVEDIRVEMRTIRTRVDGLSERVSALESSCRSATHRLDQLEGRKTE